MQLQSADRTAVSNWLVPGEVVAVHIAQSLLKEGTYDTASAPHILRGGGGNYFTVGPEQLFKMHRSR